MALEMRARCERCETTELPPDGPARICSYECTFCVPCAQAMAQTCPNCGGELVPRPRRPSADVPVQGHIEESPGSSSTRSGHHAE